MEHTERTIEEHIYPHEYEQASNSYLMSVVAVIAGLPIPILNLFAAVIFYLGSRKGTYFVRWHAIQSALGQAVLVPFNSVAVAWTIRVLVNGSREVHFNGNDYETGSFVVGSLFDAGSYYWLYIIIVLLLNLIEFIIVIYTASRVRKGHNVRWFVLANLADSLTSKENRDPYRR